MFMYTCRECQVHSSSRRNRAFRSTLRECFTWGWTAESDFCTHTWPARHLWKETNQMLHFTTKHDITGTVLHVCSHMKFINCSSRPTGDLKWLLQWDDSSATLQTWCGTKRQLQKMSVTTSCCWLQWIKRGVSGDVTCRAENRLTN